MGDGIEGRVREGQTGSDWGVVVWDRVGGQKRRKRRKRARPLFPSLPQRQSPAVMSDKAPRKPTQQTAWAGSNLFLVEPTTRHAINRDKLSVQGKKKIRLFLGRINSFCMPNGMAGGFGWSAESDRGVAVQCSARSVRDGMRREDDAVSCVLLPIKRGG